MVAATEVEKNSTWFFVETVQQILPIYLSKSRSWKYYISTTRTDD